MSESMRARICRILHCSAIEQITRTFKEAKSLSCARIYPILAWIGAFAHRGKKS